jgi:photosystem II stability/assembly factor-like uncharacterized protein
MKKKILIFVIVIMGLITAGRLNSQWIEQYPYNPGIGLRDIEFINENTGWICGDGIILKTTNKGINWLVQDNPAPGKYLYSIHPVDSNIVYCVGYFETILKTTNGGENWIALQNGIQGQGKSYRATFFHNSLTGWVAGFGDRIYKTTNGGISFDSILIPYNTLNDIHFKNNLTGIVVGGGATVLKTTDGGFTWYQSYIVPGAYGDFRKVSVINNQYCFTVEDGKRVFKSTNYGDSFDIIGYVTGADQPYSCRFSSLQTGWVCGTFGQIFKSIDGGATWNYQYVNTTNIGWLRSFWFHDDYTGWAVGGNTKLLFTSTGGATFAGVTGTEFPDKYILHQNYPNPFNSSTVIEFDIPEKAAIRLSVYDILGREVYVLFRGTKSAGHHKIILKNENLKSGIYFVKLIAGSNIEKTIRIVLIK